jgi:N-methylhydantoinase B
MSEQTATSTNGTIMSTTAPPTSDKYFLSAQEVHDTYGVDLITGEVLRNSLIDVTRQMHGSMLRGAFSPIVRESMDFAVVLHAVNEDGTTDLVAITEGCPQFAFTHQHMANMILDEYGLENLGPGDTLVCNDPWRGGVHYGDLNFFRVLFDETGKPAFVLSDAAHVYDIGGPTPGGFNMGAQTMYEEGIRIPPMLIVSGGVMVRPTVNLLLENTRDPHMMIGDVRALLGTLKTGEERMHALIGRYGIETVRSAARYTLGLSERRMRAALEQVPDGVYSAERFIDDDGIQSEPLRLSVSITIRGSRGEIDFSGTDPQCVGPLTTCWEDAARSLVGPKIMLDPRHPMNAGAMRPFDVIIPPGSMLMGLPPTSQSNHIEAGNKVAAVTIDALSHALPDRGVASDSGTTSALTYWGYDTRPGLEGVPYFGIFMAAQGWGGTSVSDGISFCMSPMWNGRAGVIEMAEIGAPYVIWEWSAVMDSAGAGKHRSGFASAASIEALVDGFFTPFTDGARLAAPGVHGGSSGPTCVGMIIDHEPGTALPAWNGIMPAGAYTPMFGIYDDEGRPDPVNGTFGNGTLVETCHLVAYPVKAGQVYRFISGGAGGCGDSLERDPQRVLRDVIDERVSLRQARESYGVVVVPETLSLDLEATEQLRAELRRKREAGEWETPQSYFRGWPLNIEELNEIKAAAAGAVRQEA